MARELSTNLTMVRPSTSNGSVWKRYESFPWEESGKGKDIGRYPSITRIHGPNLRMFGGPVQEIWGVQGTKGGSP